MKYRAEIDGLRALAVIPVILFHSGLELFHGGFVGVDVFFVISGYLITTILIDDIEKDRFSLGNFYERRARRILPALLLVMLVCLPFAWMWMLPDQMKDFAQSLVAVSLFASNFLFWSESGYFAPAAEEKPLLHTWSLAVEEQYYLLFPVFLMLAWRFGRDKVFWAIAIMALLSLLGSELGWRFRSSANFYLAPSRAWELFAGSISAFVVQKHGVGKSDFFALLGLTAIIFSIFAYDENTPFPSLYTLVPVIGVVLLILYGSRETIAARILSTKALVGTGLISYSAYLWHQPLFAFAHIKLSGEPDGALMLSLSGLSIILAFISWKYVEKPFRNQDLWSRKQIFLFSLGGISLFTFIGLIGYLSNGFQQRFQPSDLAFLSQINDDNGRYVEEKFNALKMTDWQPGKKKIFLVGDSYAQDLANAIHESEAFEEASISTWPIGSRCGNLFIPIGEKKPHIAARDLPGCEKTDLFTSEDFVDRLKGADEVWLASKWQLWQVELLPQSLGKLKASTDAKLIVFGRKDFPHFEPRQYVGLSAKSRALVAAPVDAEQIEINQRLSVLTEEYSFVDVQSLMCGGDPSECKIFDSKGYIKTYDGRHLTRRGAIFYGEELQKVLPGYFSK